MKTIGITGTAVLTLLLGLTVAAYGQQGQQGEKQDHAKQQQSKEAKPDQQHAQQQHAQQAQRQDQAKQQRHGQQAQRQDQNKQQQHAQRAQRQDQAKQQQHAQQAQRQDQNKQQHAQQQRSAQHSQRTPEQQRVQQSAWQGHRSQNWDSDHRTWDQRGGYNGYRIPEERFRGNFGPDHGFRIYGRPFMVVGGFPRFQYGGYWFSMVDPWPGYWADNWYDTDDVYVIYVNNGYYMVNRRYPNSGIAISISL